MMTPRVSISHGLAASQLSQMAIRCCLCIIIHPVTTGSRYIGHVHWDLSVFLGMPSPGLRCAEEEFAFLDKTQHFYVAAGWRMKLLNEGTKFTSNIKLFMG